MGVIYRRRVRTPGGHLNVSTRGVSATARAGRVTFNSRGRVSFRLLAGLSYRTHI